MDEVIPQRKNKSAVLGNDISWKAYRTSIRGFPADPRLAIDWSSHGPSQRHTSTLGVLADNVSRVGMDVDGGEHSLCTHLVCMRQESIEIVDMQAGLWTDEWRQKRLQPTHVYVC